MRVGVELAALHELLCEELAPESASDARDFCEFAGLGDVLTTLHERAARAGADNDESDEAAQRLIEVCVDGQAATPLPTLLAWAALIERPPSDDWKRHYDRLVARAAALFRARLPRPGAARSAALSLPGSGDDDDGEDVEMDESDDGEESRDGADEVSRRVGASMQRLLATPPVAFSPLVRATDAALVEAFL